MSNLKKAYKLIRKKKIEKIINNMKESYGTVDIKLINFLEQLESYGFFLNLNDNDIYYSDVSILTAKKISIGIDKIYNKKTRIGIDPSFCFNKTGDCSIIAYFPMSKREYMRFVKLFHKLLSNTHKTNFVKVWFKEALSSWCGNYATFGNI